MILYPWMTSNFIKTTRISIERLGHPMPCRIIGNKPKNLFIIKLMLI